MMDEAAHLRQMKAFSTDPAWLEREAQLAESRAEWREECRRLKPDITDAQFEEMWPYLASVKIPPAAG